MILSTTILETAHGTYSVSMHQDNEGERCLTLSMGELHAPGTLVRLHSSCLFGEALMAYDCDCGQQLAMALEEISRRGAGVVVYLFQEGRGAGLDRKIEGMERQRVLGLNSYEAYESLGLARDVRSYRVAATALADLEVARAITLMSNNPTKLTAMEELGYKVESCLALSYEVNPRAYEYLLMKRTHGRHTLDFSKISFVGQPNSG